jgi:hypothetical protein
MRSGGNLCPDPLRFRLTVARHTIRPPLFSQSLFSDPNRLGAIIDEALVEPGVLQRLFGGDALLWIVHEDLA